MSKTTYLVRFRPVEDYFFGGEKTFGSYDQASYFAESMKLPQQTTLLGAMRFLLLSEGFAIGDDSFNGQGKHQVYGRIDGLSPLFLQFYNGIHYESLLPIPQLKKEKDLIPVRSTTSLDYQPIFYTESKLKNGWLIKDYSPKKGVSDVLVDMKTGNRFLPHKVEKKNLKSYLPLSDLFQESTKPGITKNRTGQSDSKGFFKLQSQRLRKDFFFAFYITLDIKGFQKRGIFHLGGEKKLFQVKIEATEGNEKDSSTLFNDFFNEDWFDQHIQLADQYFILLSDTYLDPDVVLPQCKFSISTAKSFRHIITPKRLQKNFHSNLSDYAKAGPNKNYMSKSENKVLLKRGSILVPKNSVSCQLIKDEITRYPGYYQIGYNHYFLHSKKNNNE